MTDNGFMTVKEAANKLGVPVTTLHGWIARGDVHASISGGRRTMNSVHLTEVSTYIENIGYQPPRGQYVEPKVQPRVRAKHKPRENYAELALTCPALGTVKRSMSMKQTLQVVDLLLSWG